MSAYREHGPLARLAPRTPWYRLTWAWFRGVFRRRRRRRMIWVFGPHDGSMINVEPTAHDLMRPPPKRCGTLPVNRPE